METATSASRTVTTQRSALASSSAGAAGSSSSGGAGGGGSMPHAHTLPLCSVRSMSVASISSEGSTESHGHGVEQEEIAALTQDVRNFKEALGHLRRVFHSDRGEEFQESVSVVAHERLGDVLRVLRTVLERYPALQHTELLMAAGSLIQQVKGYDYEDERSNPKEFYESIDQLALAFSRRVPGYLMGDLDASASFLGSTSSSKTKSYETLAARPAVGRSWGRAAAGEEGQCGEQPESELLRTEQAVEVMLRRFKLCSKYLKDIITYVEKRAHLDLEYSKNLAKLAQTVRPLINEEVYFPLQSTYCTALDHDISNCTASQATNALILSGTFLDPMNAKRNDYEKRRKLLKEQWQRENKRLQEAEANKRKAYALHIQRPVQARVATQQPEQATESGGSTPSSGRPDKRRRAEEEAVQKAHDAETAYKAACIDVENRTQALQSTKADILNSLHSLLLQYDVTLKSCTMSYFQLQQALSTAMPTQFQTLFESSSQYEPGLQYHDFVKRFCALASQKHANESLGPSYPPGVDKEPRSLDSLNIDTDFSLNPQGPDGKGYFSKKAWSSSAQPGLGSDTDSSHSTKSREPSPTNLPSTSGRPGHFSGDELQPKPDADCAAESGHPSSQSSNVSRASESHRFRKIKGNNYRCQECDTKLYHHALECIECGIICHKECTKTLTIQCGPTRLPEKLSVFGADLAQHLAETNTSVPHILTKCIKEIDDNGLTIKGIYRISGVKSKVEKLCQDFETGADRVDLSGMNAHVIASVLKLYLRQLPEPLLTFKLYTHFVRIAKEWPTTEVETVDLNELQELVHSLPVHHRNSLQMLMQHLQRVSSHAETNSMPPSNLGIVFGPTLLRTPEGSASLNCLLDTVHQTKAIELLITNYKYLFPTSSTIHHSKTLLSTSVKTLDVTSSENSTLEVVLPGFIAENAAIATKEPLPSPDYDPNSSLDDQILGFISDDELAESLLPDYSMDTPMSPLLPRLSQQSHSEAPVIFRTALRDYKGLEGADSDSLILNFPDSNETQTKLKKMKNEGEKKVQGQRENEPSNQKETSNWTKPSKGTPPAMLARVESFADSDFESHLSSSLESPSPKDNDDEDGKHSVRDDGSKTDPSAPTSSVEESQSEGERDDFGFASSSPSRKTTVIPMTMQKVQHQEGKTPPSSSIMHTTKHHFSVVTSHFVGRRTSSVRGDGSSVTHHVEASKATRSQTTEETPIKKSTNDASTSDVKITKVTGKQNSCKEDQML